MVGGDEITKSSVGRERTLHEDKLSRKRREDSEVSIFGSGSPEPTETQQDGAQKGGL